MIGEWMLLQQKGGMPMNSSNLFPSQANDKSIFIVKSKIGSNKYKIKGSDGTLLEYISTEALLPNEIICFSMKEYKKLLQSTGNEAEVKVASKEHKNIPVAENENDTTSSSTNVAVNTAVQTTNTRSSKFVLKPQNDWGSTLKPTISRSRVVITSKEETRNAEPKNANLIERNATKKVEEQDTEEKKSFIADREQDKIVLRYLRESKVMNPEQSVRYLLEARKIQSIFAIYELFYDSRNGSNFGEYEYTDKFIKSTISQIPRTRVFEAIRKLMEAEFLHKGTIPHLEDIRKRGWRTFSIIAYKIR